MRLRLVERLRRRENWLKIPHWKDPQRRIGTNPLSGRGIVCLICYKNGEEYAPECNLSFLEQNQVKHKFESLDETERSRVTPDSYYLVKSAIATMEPKRVRKKKHDSRAVENSKKRH